MDPERALQTAPVVHLGEASRVAASLKHAQEQTPGSGLSSATRFTATDPAWLSNFR